MICGWGLEVLNPSRLSERVLELIADIARSIWWAGVGCSRQRGSDLELHVGQKATRSLTFTEDSVKAYAEITGDYNPLHFDRDFAAKTKFKKLVVQGGLTAGILNALVGMDMPGPGTVFMNQNLQYTAPVFIGDTITAEAEI